MNKLRSVPAWAWALLFAVALCLPRLGGFGLWEPWELNVAERARRMTQASGGEGLSLGVLAAAAARAELGPAMQAVGVQLFGASELGARLFGALSAVGALMAVFWAALGLFRRRAAILAVLALGTMPLFALSARQITSDMPLVAALALTIGGLARWTWPPDGRRRTSHLVAALAGLAVGFATGGALLGVALPALALVVSVAICSGLPVQASAADSTDGTGVLAEPGVGPDVVTGRTFGANLRAQKSTLLLLGALGAVGLALLVTALTQLVAGHRSPFIGGTPRGGVPTITFEYLIRQLGFGLFPWSAVAFFALGRPLIRLDDVAEAAKNSPTDPVDATNRDVHNATHTNSRLAFGQTFLLLFAGFGLVFSTYQALVIGEARYVALAAIALAIGAFLDEALEGNRSEPVAGLLIATGTMVVARDFFLSPEELASVHLLGEKVKWPPVLSVGYLVLGFGLLVALGVYAGLATRGKALGKVAGRDLSGARPWQRKLEPKIVEAGRFGLQIAVGAAVVFGFWLTQVVVPSLSTHLSFKPMIETYAKYAKRGEKFGRYRIEGKGTAFYSGLTMIDLPSQEGVVTFLRAPDRVFALVSAEELAALDAALKTAQVPYYAVDASSSRFLLLTNRLESGETDNNPLRKNVWMAPTSPASNGGQWNAAEQPPWKWRIPLDATFGDAIEIVGAQYPESVRRPGKIPLELFFRVKTRPPAGYKIFVHFDGPATPRVIGDHDPVGKAFPTANWLVGEYIRDLYEVEVPLMTTPAGTYQILMGFWPGGDGRRLKITKGANDGADRLRVGSIEIK
ncbi:MAG: glycosyltransferase family 39 protein [Deltaproteobacteria bacterium]|nr:glycosyltransferase family 39 protein [Deltaproteobacteria bacterium]